MTLDAEMDLLSNGRMDRIVGIETEYGCLLSGGDTQGTSDAWPVKVKNYLFRKAQVGTIDLHYRDYEEPPGQWRFSFQRRPALSRHGAHRIRLARVPASARHRDLRSRRR